MSDFKAFHLIDAYRLCKDDITVLIVSNNLSSVFQQQKKKQATRASIVKYDIYCYKYLCVQRPLTGVCCII